MMMLIDLSRYALNVIWLLFLLGLFNHFWQKRGRLLEAKAWLKAKGHITSCHWTQQGHSVWPEITYTYYVYNKRLIGHYLFLDTLHNNPNSSYARHVAYQVAIAFKEHLAIDIYYNPNHPEQSALDVTIPKKLNLIIGLISGALAFHVITIIFSFFAH